MASHEKINRLVRLAEWIALLAMAAVAIYACYLLLNRAELEAVLSANIPGPITSPPGWAVAAAALLLAVPAAIFVVSMWQVRRLFRLLKDRNFTELGFGATLRRLGWLAVLGGLSGFVVRTLIPLLMTVANPPGQKILIIEFNSGQVASLIMGLLFFMFTHVFADVARIDEDNKSII